MPSVDGIISGLDTTSLINGILGVLEVPKQKIEDQIGRLQKTREYVAGLTNRFDDLLAALREIDDSTELDAVKATSSDAAILGATANAGARVGDYTVTVTQLAKVDTWQSDGVADKTTPTVAHGTLSLSYGGVALPAITVDATNDSLEGLAGAIDALDGVSAWVVNSGDATNPYKLVVQGDASGSANTVTLDTSGLTGTGTVPAFSHVQTASNAAMTSNGVTYSSSSNTFSDALPGLTLTAHSLGSATVGVANDDEEVVARLQKVVDAFNGVMSYYATGTVYNPDSGIIGPLIGESGAMRAVDGAGRTLSGSYTLGLAFSGLSQLGFATQRDGSMQLDTAKLREALVANRDDVIGFLTADTGPLGTLADNIEKLYVDETNGSLATRQDSIEGQISTMEDRVDAMEERIAAERTRLKNQFTQMELAMSRLQSSSSYISAIFSQAQGQSG